MSTLQTHYTLNGPDLCQPLPRLAPRARTHTESLRTEKPGCLVHTDSPAEISQFPVCPLVWRVQTLSCAWSIHRWRANPHAGTHTHTAIYVRKHQRDRQREKRREEKRKRRELENSFHFAAYARPHALSDLLPELGPTQFSPLLDLCKLTSGRYTPVGRSFTQSVASVHGSAPVRHAHTHTRTHI